jgi:nucleoside 2-deoxyribosyltransferase
VKVYLAGPMSGIPYFNYPLFDEVAASLRKQSFEVSSPADNNRVLYPDIESSPGFDEGKGEEIDTPEGAARRYAIMHDDIQSVLAGDAIVMLPGWEKSVGSTIERRVAETCGKKVYLAILTEAGDDWWLIQDDVQVRFPPDLTTRTLTRAFESGAIRDTDERKHDYEGFLSIAALRAYGEYMHQHRHLNSGDLRASDNWQQGFPVDVLVKSALRHMFDVWELHRVGKATDFDGRPVELTNALCGVLFNVFALLHQEATK